MKYLPIEQQRSSILKFFIVLILLFSISTNLISCSKEKEEGKFISSSEVLVDQLNHYYNWETGLWETTSWWNGANILTALIKNGKQRKDASIIEIIENTFAKTKRFDVPGTDKSEAWTCENYINDYYDDEGWWALAWLDAWELTDDPKYLKMSQTIFSDITLGWNDTCDGGILWKKGLKYKSTISNELTMVLAARLHLADTKPINGKSCLQWAESIWSWILSSKLMNDNNQIQDGIREIDGDCGINERVWTYNQGVILSGLVYLDKINKNSPYLEYAHKIASAVIEHMTNRNGILMEVICEPGNCDADQEQFKGIYIRHLAKLNEYDEKKEYSQFLLRNAESIHKISMINGTIAPGVSWSKNSERQTAATASSALDAMNAVLNILTD